MNNKKKSFLELLKPFKSWIIYGTLILIGLVGVLIAKKYIIKDQQTNIHSQQISKSKNSNLSEKIDMKQYVKDELKKMNNDLDKKRVVLDNNKILILWNSVYHTKNIYYKDYQKDVKKLSYIEYKIKDKNGKWYNVSNIVKIESKLYDCKFNKDKTSIICNKKIDLTKTNLKQNTLGDNLYLFSIVTRK